VVVGNTFYGNKADVRINNQGDVGFGPSDNVLIANNVSHDADEAFVEILGAVDFVTIRGNHVYNCGAVTPSPAISIANDGDGEIDRFIIADNVFIGVAGMTYGVAVESGTPTNLHLIGNYITGATSGVTSGVVSKSTWDIDNDRLYLNTALKVFLGTGSVASTIQAHIADATGATLNFQKTRNATADAHTIVSASDIIGTLAFQASDGDQFVTGARIRAVVDGTPGDNDMPTRLGFWTTNDGSATVTERVIVGPEGGLFLLDGITAPAARTGFAAIYVDTADGNLKVKFGDGFVAQLAADA
jgi:hypothetical protein